MTFDDLSMRDKVAYTKREFIIIVKTIFENPENIKAYVNNKSISNDQSKDIIRCIFSEKLNSKKCSCCRRFDQNKLQLTPIEEVFEPLLEIAKTNVKSRRY